jgi:hypothetical protein
MRRGARSNKALQLAANSAFQLWFGSLLASTLGAWAASEALLAAAERQTVGPTWRGALTAAGAWRPSEQFGEDHAPFLLNLLAYNQFVDQALMKQVEESHEI